jgi:hypothetical protein
MISSTAASLEEPRDPPHKVALHAAGDVDDEVAGLLRPAYEQNG